MLIDTLSFFLSISFQEEEERRRTDTDRPPASTLQKAVNVAKFLKSRCVE